MHSITIEAQRTDLIDIIRGNLEKHKVDVQTAIAGQLEEARDVLSKALAEVGTDPGRSITVSIPGVENHTQEYESVIRMLELDTRETVTLNAVSYAQFVEDSWAWKSNWTAQNSKYLAQ